MSLQAQLLANWRELCLTPKALKQAMADSDKKKASGGTDITKLIATIEKSAGI
jgi:hypothetical protein